MSEEDGSSRRFGYHYLGYRDWSPPSAGLLDQNFTPMLIWQIIAEIDPRQKYGALRLDPGG